MQVGDWLCGGIWWGGRRRIPMLRVLNHEGVSIVVSFICISESLGSEGMHVSFP